MAAAQRRLWEELGGAPRGFVLYGGTALALRFEHRSSEDFDFFANRNPLPSLKALCCFGDGDLTSLPGEVCTRLAEAAGRVDPLRIPEMQPLPGGIAP